MTTPVYDVVILAVLYLNGLFLYPFETPLDKFTQSFSFQ